MNAGKKNNINQLPAFLLSLDYSLKVLTPFKGLSLRKPGNQEK